MRTQPVRDEVSRAAAAVVEQPLAAEHAGDNRTPGSPWTVCQPASHPPALASAQDRLRERRRRPPSSALKGTARSGLTFTTAAMGDSRVLTVYGVLDDTTYIRVRDAVIKAALDEYRALIIDVTSLAVATPSAWSVFTTTRSHVAQRSDILMALVCGTINGQKALGQ